MDPCADAVSFHAKAQGVVEILGLLGIDGEGGETAKIYSVRLLSPWLRRHGRVATPNSFMPEQPLEHTLDVVGRPKGLFDSGAPTRRLAQEHEISDRSVPRSLSVDHDRPPALEERVADEELAAPGELGDDGLHARS
jgi:hypothetical protein